MNVEANNFINLFHRFKNSRIVFYGIGTTAQAVISEVLPLGWKIVGLLDRDEKNIGRVICGIPVIAAQTAKEEADLIVIMSDQSHYEVIYRRIRDLGIPVYYRSGEKAYIKVLDESYKYLDYWKYTLKDLQEEIRTHDVVSFDFFDTLVMRKIYEPQDVFKLLENRLAKDNIKFRGFGEIRESAITRIKKTNPTIYDIYKSICDNGNYTKEELAQAINIEYEIEESLIVPRSDIVDALNFALKEGKKVYIVSDMYYSADILYRFADKNGISGIDKKNLIVSCDVGESKKDNLWGYYRELIGDKRALHIGDNLLLDVELPREKGIDTFYVMSGIDMLKNSSIHSLNDFALNLNDSVHIGLIIEKLFNSPFALSESRGRVRISDFNTLGYVAFGGVICRFFNWLLMKVQENKFQRVLFFARDGYFLKIDFEEYIKHQHLRDHLELIYVPISRRLVLISSINNDNDLLETIKYPYVGTFGSYMRDRFNVVINPDDPNYAKDINSANDYEAIESYMRRYNDAVWREINRERKNYLKLLKGHNIGDNEEKDLLVDLGYKGTTQFLFEKTVAKKYNCAYFFCDFTNDNNLCKVCNMDACFNDINTPNGYDTLFGRKALFLESFLTAPHGNIDYVGDEGNLVFSEEHKNQRFFDSKIEINSGVLEYLSQRLKIEEGLLNGKAEDGTLDVILSRKCDISESIMKTFWIDNDVLGVREELLEL